MAVPLRLGGGAPGPWARPARWLAHAWRRLGWRQVALAALLAVAAALLAPNGGVIVLLDESRQVNFIAGLLAGRWITIVPLVFAAMLADEASRDGVRPVLARTASRSCSAGRRRRRSMHSARTSAGGGRGTRSG